MICLKKCKIVSQRCRRKAEKENPVRIRNDAVTVYGSGLQCHWETGKGSAAMNEVRRPASAGNLKPAAHRLIFLRVYPRRDHVRGAVLLVGSVRAAVDPQPLLYFFQNDF